MKKLIIITLSLICVVLCVASCSNGDAPRGMKIACDTSIVDYTLYVPESWIIDSMGHTSSAHASDSDRSSISVKKTSVDTIDKWWQSYKNALTTTFKDLKLEIEGEDYVLATLNGKKYAFTASFNNASYYKYEIIAIEKGGYVYEILIKYQGIMKNGTVSYSDEIHKDNIKKILDNFKFNDGLAEGSDVAYEAENTPSNMKCASNSKIVDYYLFVPDSWVVEKTSGTVSSAYVSENDKTNISVMQWNYKGNYDAWWNEYLLQIYSTFDYSAIPLKENGEAQADENGKISFLPSDIITIDAEIGDIKIGERDAKKYTYSVKIDGNVYDFQVYAIIYRASVYVMTFTLKDGCDMSLYQEDIDKILNNFRFI